MFASLTFSFLLIGFVKERKGIDSQRFKQVDLTQVQLAKSTEERNDLTAVLKRALESMRFSVANTDDPNPNDPEDDDDDW